MPCTYYSKEDYLRMAREDLDLATKLLCKMVSHFGVIPGDAELAKWKAEHDELDRRRLAAEEAERERAEARVRDAALRGLALAKLSPEERDALRRAKGTL